MSDVSSSSDSDFDFSTRRPSDNDDTATLGYGYYTSPDTKPRPNFTTPAIPINAPPRARSRHAALSRNTSSDSIAQSTTSSRKSTSSRQRRYPRQPHASPELHEFHVSSFVAHGRVTNYVRVLSYLPRYVRCSSACYEKLITSPKGISRATKTYVALLAAAEMGCQYFVSYFTAKFLELGGDAMWLKGIDETSGKLRRVAGLNRKMIERPWELSRADFQRLCESQTTSEGEEEGWTLNEVAQIMTILAMFHAQSAIALGSGVVCEADLYGGTVWRRISRDTASTSLERGDSEDSSSRNGFFMNGTPAFRDELVDKLRMRMLASGHLSPDMSFDNLQKLHERDAMIAREQETLLREAIKERKPATSSPVKSKLLSASLPIRSSSAKTPTPAKFDLEQPVNPVIEDLSRFVLDHTAAMPTAIPSSQPILSTKKYSWDDTLQIMQTHLPDLAANLDRRIHLPPTSQFLQNPGRERINVRPFDDALRNYSLALIGVMKDAYEYRQLNEYLNDVLRRFIQRICLDPRGILKSEWDAVRELGFSDREIVEIGAIVSEARFMGILLYAFRIIGDT